MDEKKFPFEAARNIVLPKVAVLTAEDLGDINQILFGPYIARRVHLDARLGVVVENGQVIEWKALPDSLRGLKVEKSFLNGPILGTHYHTIVLDDLTEEAMAGKKNAPARRRPGKQISDRSLKRSTTRRRGKADRPLKRGLEPQPIDQADQAQAEGHGNQRSLLARAQVQAGDGMSKSSLLNSIDELVPEPPKVEGPRTLVHTMRAVTDGYAQILRHETEEYIKRVWGALGDE